MKIMTVTAVKNGRNTSR